MFNGHHYFMVCMLIRLCIKVNKHSKYNKNMFRYSKFQKEQAFKEG